MDGRSSNAHQNSAGKRDPVRAPQKICQIHRDEPIFPFQMTSNFQKLQIQITLLIRNIHTLKMSDTDSDNDKRSSSGEDNESSQEETSPPPVKKQPAKKEESDSDDDESSNEDSEEESPPAKKTVKKVSPKKNEDSESEEEESEKEEEEEEEEEDSDGDNSKSKALEKEPKQSKTAKNAANAQLEKEAMDLRNQLKKLEDQLSERDEHIDSMKDKLESCKKNNDKLYQRLLTEEENSQSQQQLVHDKDQTILQKNQLVEEQMNQLASRDHQIQQQQETITILEGLKVANEKLKHQLQVKEEEVGVLRARLTLDLLDLDVKIVAEYPDMVEENHSLFAQVEQLNQQISDYVKGEHSFQEENYDLSQKVKEKDQSIKVLEKLTQQFQKKIKDHQKTEKHLKEIQLVNEQQVSMLEGDIQKKNDELEDRLEITSKLIQKNEQLSQQLRVQRSRLEKFKKEQVGKYDKEINDKSSEIEVLKEMVKGNQLQVRAREKEVARFKSRAQQLEGQLLALRQQQNYQMNSSSINQTPSSYKSFSRAPISQSKISNPRFASKNGGGGSHNKLPPVEARHYDQVSQHSQGAHNSDKNQMKTLSREFSYESQIIMPELSPQRVKASQVGIKPQISKRIDEAVEEEQDQSWVPSHKSAQRESPRSQLNKFETVEQEEDNEFQGEQQLRSSNNERESSIDRQTQEMRTVVQDENDQAEGEQEDKAAAKHTEYEKLAGETDDEQVVQEAQQQNDNNIIDVQQEKGNQEGDGAN